eukprot:GHVR01112095.1.p1 GENE.GHVR01112095.1~~GHVR01112095.1.p1  ORF type:complete len:242 (+),score=25.68 GHVR01112095.1:426-1151(+)
MANRFVKKLGSYVNLTKAEVSALTKATASATAVPPRTDLIREGDRPGPVFVVLEGWVLRLKVLPAGSRQIFGYLLPGDACDLHAGLLDQMDHSIQTVTSAVVARIDRNDMDALMDRHRGIERAMYISQLVDEGTLRAWITSIGRRSSLERVAHLLSELYVRARNVGLTDDERLELPLTQSMLADSTGMTTVHLNRVLKELRSCGAMTVERGSLAIIDVDKLIRTAGFDETYLHRRLSSGRQ